ncbi:MAG: GNAT family N-acetyltransferase [Candidatus Caldatribacteriaceae bacterium]
MFRGVSIIIRKADFGEGRDFANLFLLSAPFFLPYLGTEEKVKKILSDFFREEGNLFGFQNTLFATVNQVIVGMAFWYDWQTRRRDGLRTGWELFQRLGFRFLFHLRWWIVLGAITGNFHFQGGYLSNLAVYPDYQRRGIGKKLLLAVEEEARKRGLSYIELDVERENWEAITFYQKAGYETQQELGLSWRDTTLVFLRMRKKIR